MSTGYFGIPGRKRGRVHIVSNGKPICGEKINPKASYHWCAQGISIQYVECLRCRERGLKILNKGVK